jgi:hypothetical protein
MDGEVLELDSELRPQPKDLFVDLANALPSTLVATKWVVDGCLFGINPVQLHKLHVLFIERFVVLN